MNELEKRMMTHRNTQERPSTNIFQTTEFLDSRHITVDSTPRIIIGDRTEHRCTSSPVKNARSGTIFSDIDSLSTIPSRTYTNRDPKILEEGMIKLKESILKQKQNSKRSVTNYRPTSPTEVRFLEPQEYNDNIRQISRYVVPSKEIRKRKKAVAPTLDHYPGCNDVQKPLRKTCVRSVKIKTPVIAAPKTSGQPQRKTVSATGSESTIITTSTWRQGVALSRKVLSNKTQDASVSSTSSTSESKSTESSSTAVPSEKVVPAKKMQKKKPASNTSSKPDENNAQKKSPRNPPVRRKPRKFIKPEPLDERPVVKARHYNPNDVQTYIEETKKHRKKQMAEERRKNIEAEKEKEKRLQKLFEFQKKALKRSTVCTPTSPSPPKRKEAWELYERRNVTCSDSDKENTLTPTNGSIQDIPLIPLQCDNVSKEDAHSPPTKDTDDYSLISETVAPISIMGHQQVPNTALLDTYLEGNIDTNTTSLYSEQRQRMEAIRQTAFALRQKIYDETNRLTAEASKANQLIAANINYTNLPGVGSLKQVSADENLEEETLTGSDVSHKESDSTITYQDVLGDCPFRSPPSRDPSPEPYQYPLIPDHYSIINVYARQRKMEEERIELERRRQVEEERRKQIEEEEEERLRLANSRQASVRLQELEMELAADKMRMVELKNEQNRRTAGSLPTTSKSPSQDPDNMYDSDMSVLSGDTRNTDSLLHTTGSDLTRDYDVTQSRDSYDFTPDKDTDYTITASPTSTKKALSFSQHEASSSSIVKTPGPETGLCSPAALHRKLRSELMRYDAFSLGMEHVNTLQHTQQYTESQQDTVAIARAMQKGEVEHASEMSALQDKLKKDMEAFQDKLNKVQTQSVIQHTEVPIKHPEVIAKSAALDASIAESHEQTNRELVMMAQQILQSHVKPTTEAISPDTTLINTEPVTPAKSEELESLMSSVDNTPARDSEMYTEEEPSPEKVHDSFIAVLPSESHRRRMSEESITSLSRKDSFVTFTMKQVNEYVKDEEVRAKHQKSLLELRNKALKEKSDANLKWIEMKKKRIQRKGEDDKMPPLLQTEKAILTKLADDQDEIRRLHMIQKSAQAERKKMLLQHQQITKIQQRTIALRRKIKRAEDNTEEVSDTDMSESYKSYSGCDVSSVYEVDDWTVGFNDKTEEEREERKQIRDMEARILHLKEVLSKKKGVQAKQLHKQQQALKKQALEAQEKSLRSQIDAVVDAMESQKRHFSSKLRQQPYTPTNKDSSRRSLFRSPVKDAHSDSSISPDNSRIISVTSSVSESVNKSSKSDVTESMGTFSKTSVSEPIVYQTSLSASRQMLSEQAKPITSATQIGPRKTSIRSDVTDDNTISTSHHISENISISSSVSEDLSKYVDTSFRDLPPQTPEIDSLIHLSLPELDNKPKSEHSENENSRSIDNAESPGQKTFSTSKTENIFLLKDMEALSAQEPPSKICRSPYAESPQPSLHHSVDEVLEDLSISSGSSLNDNSGLSFAAPSFRSIHSSSPNKSIDKSPEKQEEYSADSISEEISEAILSSERSSSSSSKHLNIAKELDAEIERSLHSDRSRNASSSKINVSEKLAELHLDNDRISPHFSRLTSKASMKSYTLSFETLDNEEEVKSLLSDIDETLNKSAEIMAASKSYLPLELDVDNLTPVVSINPPSREYSNDGSIRPLTHSTPRVSSRKRSEESDVSSRGATFSNLTAISSTTSESTKTGSTTGSTKTGSTTKRSELAPVPPRTPSPRKISEDLPADGTEHDIDISLNSEQDDDASLSVSKSMSELKELMSDGSAKTDRGSATSIHDPDDILKQLVSPTSDDTILQDDDEKTISEKSEKTMSHKSSSSEISEDVSQKDRDITHEIFQALLKSAFQKMLKVRRNKLQKELNSSPKYMERSPTSPEQMFPTRREPAVFNDTFRDTELESALMLARRSVDVEETTVMTPELPPPPKVTVQNTGSATRHLATAATRHLVSCIRSSLPCTTDTLDVDTLELPQDLSYEEQMQARTYQQLVLSTTTDCLHTIDEEYNLSCNEKKALPPWTPQTKRRPRPHWMRGLPAKLTLENVDCFLPDTVVKILGLSESCLPRKYHHMEQLLTLEVRDEETEWTNYDADELAVKFRIADTMLTALLCETVAVFAAIDAKS